MIEPSLIAKLPMICFAVLLVWAAVTDLSTYTIPNRLNLAMAALWPAHLIAQPGAFDPYSLMAAVLVLMIGFGLFVWGKLGGGDVKLMAVTSLWLSSADVPTFLFVTALVGGAMALLVVGPFRALVLAAVQIAGAARLSQGIDNGQLPYGVAIAAGGLTALMPRLLG